MRQDWKTLGTWFKEKRKELGLEVEDAITRSKAKRTTITQFEAAQDGRPPTTDIVAKLCYAYAIGEKDALEMIYSVAREEDVEIHMPEPWWVYEMNPHLRGLSEKQIKSIINHIRHVADAYRETDKQDS